MCGSILIYEITVWGIGSLKKQRFKVSFGQDNRKYQRPQNTVYEHKRV